MTIRYDLVGRATREAFMAEDPATEVQDYVYDNFPTSSYSAGMWKYPWVPRLGWFQLDDVY